MISSKKIFLSLVLAASLVSAQQRKSILILGETGAGKSTFGNELLGKDEFMVGHGLDSCTEDIKSVETYLFGDPAAEQKIIVSDSGGLGDSEGRDEEFLDDIASYIRSQNGIHGVVYVQNACQTRMNKQTQDSLKAMVATLTNLESQEELRNRLTIVLTQCTDPTRRVLWQAKLLAELCNKFQLCNVPLVWYDGSGGSISQTNQVEMVLYSIVASIGRMLLGTPPGEYLGWKQQFATWVGDLPTKAIKVPSESEREKLKKEHEEHVLQNGVLEKELHQLREELRVSYDKMGDMHELTEKIRQLQEELDSRYVSAGCFSAESQVIDRQLGSIALKDLTVGSEVATRDGWSTVTTFLHWHPDDEIDALTITFEHGALTLTPEHMVFVVAPNRQVRVIAAKEVKRHALMLVQKEGKTFSSIVHSVQSVKMSGFYAPVTNSGTIVVDNIVASCYTQDGKIVVNHWIIHMIMAPLRLVLPAKFMYVPNAGEIHPYARWLLGIA